MWFIWRMQSPFNITNYLYYAVSPGLHESNSNLTGPRRLLSKQCAIWLVHMVSHPNGAQCDWFTWHPPLKRLIWLAHADFHHPNAHDLIGSRGHPFQGARSDWFTWTPSPSSRHQPERRMAWFTQTLAAFFTLWLDTVFFFDVALSPQWPYRLLGTGKHKICCEQ